MQNIVRKAGSWYSYGETRIGQGREKTIDFLETNPDIGAEVEQALLAKLFPPEEPVEEAETAAAEAVAVG